MTVIVYRDGVMAADTATSIHGGDCRMPGRVQKLWRLADGGAFGLAGVRRHIVALEGWLNNPVGDPPDTGEDITALIVRPSGLLTIHDGRLVFEPKDVAFWAIGSGAPAALGALYAGASAEEAARIATKVDPYSGGEVDTLKIEIPRGKQACRCLARCQISDDVTEAPAGFPWRCRRLEGLCFAR